MIDTILLDGLWQGAFVAAVAALVTVLLPRRNAATRYAVWFTALLALAILPMSSLWHPAQTFTALPASVVHTASIASRVTERTVTASGWWLMAIWLTGGALCLFRLGVSYHRINRIVRGATLAPELGTSVLISDDVMVPIAARLFSPVVVIPANLAATLERSDLESLVRHERAHIRRMDIVGNFIQRVVEAGLFFNPWVYVIGRQLIKEREAACDDWVVHATHDPDRYALCLSQLAQGVRQSHPLLLTPSAIGSGHMLVTRVARLLDGKAGQLKINYFVLGASILAFAILGVLLGTSQGLASAGLLPSASAASVVSDSSCTFPHGYTDVKPINPVAPSIPKSDYRAGLSAGALVTVGPDGRAVSAKIVKSSGNAAIDRATVDAAMASTYSPATKACKPVAGMYLFHIETGP